MFVKGPKFLVLLALLHQGFYILQLGCKIECASVLLNKIGGGLSNPFIRTG